MFVIPAVLMEKGVSGKGFDKMRIGCGLKKRVADEERFIYLWEILWSLYKSSAPTLTHYKGKITGESDTSQTISEASKARYSLMGALSTCFIQPQTHSKGFFEWKVIQSN